MTNFSKKKYVRHQLSTYRLIILVAKTLVANVNDKFRNKLFW